MIPTAMPANDAAPVNRLAFVSLQTAGLDPDHDELLEIAVVCVDARSLEVLSERDILVLPERLDPVNLHAIAHSGHASAAWRDAVPLHKALSTLAPLLDGAGLAGHGIAHQRPLLERMFRRAGVAPPRLECPMLDTSSLVWPLYAAYQLPSLTLDAIATYLGLERTLPVRALTDARCALEVARRLGDRMRVGGRLDRLVGDERPIVEAVLDRLELGRRQYGPWHVHDARDYAIEAYAEVLDALNYVAAALVRQRRASESRLRRVYICSPFAGDECVARVRAIGWQLLDKGELPIAPHLYLPQLAESLTGDRAQTIRLELINTCDVVRVYGERITASMEEEIRYARERSISVEFEAML